MLPSVPPCRQANHEFQARFGGGLEEFPRLSPMILIFGLFLKTEGLCLFPSEKHQEIAGLFLRFCSQGGTLEFQGFRFRLGVSFVFVFLVGLARIGLVRIGVYQNFVLVYHWYRR